MRVPAGHEELPVFCPSPGPGESHGKSCTYGAGGKHTGIMAADKRIGLFSNFSHNSPSRSRKELLRSNPRQEPGNGTPTTDGTNCSLLQLVAGHREGRVLRQEP